jgi:predicted O-methyltransferase YrrM
VSVLRRLFGPAIRSAAAAAPPAEAIIPVGEDPSELIPDLYDREVRVRLWPWRFGHPVNDQALLFMALLAARTRDPIVEFGTFDGRTTYNMALNHGGDRIVTIDAGIAADTSNAERKEYGAFRPGACFRDAPESLRSRITLIEADSRSVELPELHGRAGLVFVDGGHDEATCRHDTALAMALVAPDGVVVWDDYTPYWPGVKTTLDELARRVPMRHYPRLGFVVHRAPASGA